MIITNFTRFIVMLAMIKLLTACATNGDNTQQSASKPKAEIAQQMTEIVAITESKELLFIEVPSTNNIISEKIMLAAMASGESTSATEQLKALLQKGTSTQIGVVGKSQAVNVMTVKQTLKKLASKPAKGTVYLIGDAKIKDVLSAVNQNKDINVVVINTKH